MAPHSPPSHSTTLRLNRKLASERSSKFIGEVCAWWGEEALPNPSLAPNT